MTHPILYSTRSVCKRPTRAIPDFPINLLELKTAAGASGKPGARYTLFKFDEWLIGNRRPLPRKIEVQSLR